MTDYRQHLEVETPEHVVIDYEIAGLGSRMLAALADTAIIVVLVVAIWILGSRVHPDYMPYSLPIATFAVFAVLWGYFALFEGFRDGQTPGKRWLGIRVIRDTGHAIGFREAAARNLVRLADFLPPPYFLGALFVALHPRGKRLGDLVAGTVVVRDQPLVTERSPASTLKEKSRTPSTSPVGEIAGVPLLSDAEFRVVREFGARAPQLPPDVRARFAAQLVARLADRFPTRAHDNVDFLTTLLDQEAARRRGRFGASSSRTSRAETAEARPSSGAVIERLIARKERRWSEFGAMTERATRGGLDALEAGELPDFATRYREVAADLARARTYGADHVVRTRLERLVGAGHNLLYRDDRKTWRSLLHFLAVECPATVVARWRLVLVAFLAFALPALGGYAALRERPELAEATLPAVMLERAEDGRRAVEQGRGYAQATARERAFISSYIITNNIGVAFACFAGGIFLGVGSLVSLAFNGLLLGAISGHFHNAGLLGYLWTFVAGHGVLELFAIWCAGGAGFLIGSAAVRPGEYSRRDALVVNARVAMRLVGMSIVLLLVAGTIEGFLSTSGAGTVVKVAVSLTSALFLVAYLFLGARQAAREGARDAAREGTRGAAPHAARRAAASLETTPTPAPVG